LRTFIAVDFSPEIIRKINEIIDYFKTQTPERALKWVAPKNLHLTIKFLGEVPEEKIEQIKSLIKETLNDVKSFQIGVEKLGMYPNPQKPRVVWLGITGAGPLKEIHKMLEPQLQKADIQPDRRGFSPHLTIARIRRNADIQSVKEIGEILSKFTVGSLGSCTVDHIVLYKSELTPQGPIYTVLLSSPLNKV
jgi:2'-5' RNA ligase